MTSPMSIIVRIIHQLKHSDQRSRLAIKNIGLSLLLKVANILSSFLIIPLTIDYVNPTQYGIWLTLSGVIAWINFFDFGLGSGLRNKFAEARAKGDELLASQYLSTTYAAITAIVLVIFAVILIGSQYLDWATLLNIDSSYSQELQRVFIIVSGIFGLNMIASVFSTMLTADQQPGMTALIQSIGQYLSLLAIFLLTRFTDGSLTNLALYFAGVPCLVMVLASLYGFFFTRYRSYLPHLRHIRPDLLHDIMGLGVQFFIIYLCLIVVFQLTNVVLSREIGPASVTDYNIAYKYFNVIYMVTIIVVTPFWSAFTDAYTKRDFGWMKGVIRKMEGMWLLSIAAGAVMLLASPLFYDLWVGDSVSVSLQLSLAVLLFTLASSIGGIYMHMINGIGTIRLQLIVYVAFALIAWPALVYSCRWMGVCGIVIVPTCVYTVLAIMSKIQLSKILSGQAKGIWLK